MISLENTPLVHNRDDGDTKSRQNSERELESLHDVFPAAFVMGQFLVDAFSDNCRQLRFNNNECEIIIESQGEEYHLIIGKGKIDRPLPDPDWTLFTEADEIKVTNIAGVDTKYVWVNSRYQVMVYFPDPNIPDAPRMAHLSIKRHDREPIRDWRDLQRIKNELCGTSAEACELFPAEDRLADTANQYHLWCLEPGVQFPWGFNVGRVTDDTPEAKAELYRALKSIGFDTNNSKSKQRRWEKHHHSNELSKLGKVWTKQINKQRNKENKTK